MVVFILELHIQYRSDPNLTESKPQLNPWFTFLVYKSGSRLNPEWTQRVDPVRSIPMKADANSAFGIYKRQELQEVGW